MGRRHKPRFGEMGGRRGASLCGDRGHAVRPDLLLVDAFLVVDDDLMRAYRH